MQNIIFIVIICAGVFGYHFFKDRYAVHEPAASTHVPARAQNYRCDGRTHCSQMTSCEEAKFFLDNCPGTAMDGDHDGIPCEQQWCK